MKYPFILSQEKLTDLSLLLELKILPEIIYFEGHFEGMPVLAGVVQIGWVLHYAALFLEVDKSKFQQIVQMKFTQVIRPDMVVSLSIELKGDALTFKYFSGDVVYAVGKLKSSK
tara:strand:- start:372 stop:713 length:342 start_codon:yes stop_codon:yes gene_type:complete